MGFTSKILGLILVAGLANIVAQSAKGILSPAGSPQSPKASFSIAASVADTTVKLGSDAIVNIVLTNTSDHPIVFENEMTINFNDADYSTVVRNEKGDLIPLTKFGLMLFGDDDHLPKPREVKYVTANLQPGETIKGRISVTKLYNIQAPGQYTVQIERFDEVTKSWSKSNIITLTVTP